MLVMWGKAVSFEMFEDTYGIRPDLDRSRLFVRGITKRGATP